MTIAIAVRALPALLSLTLLGLVVLLVMPAAASAKSLTVGAQSDNMLLGDAAVREAELDRLDALGVQIIRATLSWRGVATNSTACTSATFAQLEWPEHPCYDWALYDHLVVEARKRGLPLLFSVHQLPQWVLGKHQYWMGSSDRVFDTRVKPHWAAFATAAARRYNADSPYGYVRRWTVGNEPNSVIFWQPLNNSSPKRYARLYRVVAPGIRRASPRALIAPGPTGPRSTMKPAKWLAIALPVLSRNGSHRYINAWAHNAYPKGAMSPRRLMTNPPSLDITNMRTLYRILDSWRATRRKPVWVLEYAYQTNPPDRIFGVSLGRQATYLAQSWDMLADGRTKIALWYGMRDPLDQVDWQSGLWDYRGRAKPSMSMYARPIAPHSTVIRRGQVVRLFGMSTIRPRRQTLKYSYNRRSWRTVPRQRRWGAVVRASFKPRRTVYVRVVDPAGRGPVRRIRVR